MLNVLMARAGAKCEFCTASDDLAPMAVGPDADGTANRGILLCGVCRDMIEGDIDTNHMRCLGSAMWSEHAPVQVMAWRMLDRLSDQAWARDLLDQIYMEDATRRWAEVGALRDSAHKDSNGAVLNAGDNVVLIKDLPVKGAGFTAKRGTAVRGISLVVDNPAHIEGRVEGQRIVILTEFVKKK